MRSNTFFGAKSFARVGAAANADDAAATHNTFNIFFAAMGLLTVYLELCFPPNLI